MKFFSGIVTFCLALASIAASSSVEIDAPTVSWPDGFQITSVGILGSGCPMGTSNYVLDPENSSFTVSFSNFTARAGPNVGIAEHRKNCQISLAIVVPEGYRLVIRSTIYQGSYRLGRKVIASFKSVSYFQGQIQEATSLEMITGPIFVNDFWDPFSFDPASGVVSDCGAKTVLSVNTVIQVNNAENKAGSGRITMKTQRNFDFVWSRC